MVRKMRRGKKKKKEKSEKHTDDIRAKAARVQELQILVLLHF